MLCTIRILLVRSASGMSCLGFQGVRRASCSLTAVLLQRASAVPLASSCSSSSSSSSLGSHGHTSIHELKPRFRPLFLPSMIHGIMQLFEIVVFVLMFVVVSSLFLLFFSTVPVYCCVECRAADCVRKHVNLLKLGAFRLATCIAIMLRFIFF